MAEKSAADRLVEELLGRVMVEQFESALQGTGLNPARFARIIANEVRRTPDLADCPRESVIGAAMTCAELGFEPGPALGHAWIIPRTLKGRGLVANFQLGYKGLVALLWESDKISWINSRVVCVGDRFEYSLGSPPTISAFEECAEPGDISHVFASIGIRGGAEQLEVWTAARLERHVKERVHADSRAWDTDFDVMACKTLVFQAARFAPVGPRAQRAMTLHDLGERGLEQPFSGVEPASAPAATEEPEPTGQAKQNAVLRERLEAKAKEAKNGRQQRSRRSRV